MSVATRPVASPSADQTDNASYIRGAAWALFAVLIWSGWFISTRFEVLGGLGAYDLVAIRYGVTALILLPLILRLKAAIRGIDLTNLLMLVGGSGAFYGVVVTAAVGFAPAAEGAALTPGVMPLWAGVLSVLILKDRLTTRQLFGFAFTIAGVLTIAGFGLFHGGNMEWAGHLLFIAAAFLFACYTIALRRSGLTGLEATAIVSLISCVFYLPVYVIALEPRLLQAAPSSLIFAVVYQAVATNVISLIAYGRAVKALGAARTSSFAALVPVLTLLLGIPILGEIPSLLECVGIFAVSIGVFLTTGAPIPAKFRLSR